MAVECAICLKHQGEGPLTGQLVGRFDGFWVYHARLSARLRDALAAE